MKKVWSVYILECKDGSLYTGVTNNIDKRMLAHASGNGSKYVKLKGFKQLLESRECKSRSEAQKAEFYIKKLKRKDKLDWFNN
jgi:putative endonuclease